MNKYDSYKDSGFDWMNEIPSNWEKSRIRMVGDLYGGLTGKKVQIELDGGTLNINWREDGVWMTGPTMNVFSGTFSEEFLNSL